MGPSLIGTKLTADQIKATVRSGKGAMPPFTAATINDQALNDLAAYVLSLK